MHTPQRWRHLPGATTASPPSLDQEEGQVLEEEQVDTGPKEVVATLPEVVELDELHLHNEHDEKDADHHAQGAEQQVQGGDRHVQAEM